MVTKGVPSVRSPVCNLQKFNPDINHEAFVEAVVQQFRDVYKLHDAVSLMLMDFSIVRLRISDPGRMQSKRRWSERI